MQFKSWKEQVNELTKSIKVISNFYGGDEPQFLESYGNDLIEQHKDDLSIPLQALDNLVAQVKFFGLFKRP